MILIYLLIAIELIAGGSSTAHIYRKQYTEQHNETEYTAENVHKNKNT
jgi:hypothetical protein